MLWTYMLWILMRHSQLAVHCIVCLCCRVLARMTSSKAKDQYFMHAHLLIHVLTDDVPYNRFCYEMQFLRQNYCELAQIKSAVIFLLNLTKPRIWHSLPFLLVAQLPSTIAISSFLEWLHLFLCCNSHRFWEDIKSLYLGLLARHDCILNNGPKQSCKVATDDLAICRCVPCLLTIPFLSPVWLEWLFFLRLPHHGLNWNWEPLHVDHRDNSLKGLTMWSSPPPFFPPSFASIAFAFGLQLALLTVDDFA